MGGASRRAWGTVRLRLRLPEVALSRFARAALTAASVLAVLPAAAHGATFCVRAPAGCTGTPAATIQEALDAADALPGRDIVQIGRAAGAHAEGFTIVLGNEVVVDGVGQPVIVGDASARIVINEPSAVLSDVTIAAAPGADPAVDARAGTLDGVDVSGGAAMRLVQLGDATLHAVRVLGDRATKIGIDAVGPGGVLDGVEVTGGVAVQSSSADLRIRRAELVGAGGGTTTRGLRVTGGATTVDDASIAAAGGGPGEIAVDIVPSPGDATVALRSTTVAGDASTATTGIRALCDGHAADVALTDVAVSWAAVDLERSGPGCAMRLDHVRYRTADAHGGVLQGDAALATGPLGLGLWIPMATFVPALASPLVDAGTARPATAGETDQLGRARVVDADADGRAARDVGALEYQRLPPVAALFGPATMTTDDLAVFDARGSYDPDLSDPLTARWALDGDPVGEAASGAVATVRLPTPGVHVVAVTVTDPSGQTSSAARRVEVTGPDRSAGDPAATPFTTATVQAQGPATVPPADAPRTLSVSAVATRLRRDGLRFQIRCRQTARCSGTLRAIASFAPRKATRLGQASFRIAGGRSAVVRVTVSTALRRRLARAHAVDVSVIAAHAGAPADRWAETVFRLRA